MTNFLCVPVADTNDKCAQDRSCADEEYVAATICPECLIQLKRECFRFHGCQMECFLVWMFRLAVW